LRAAHNGHRALDPYNAIQLPNSQPRTKVYELKINSPMPPFGLYVGDFVHAMRCALDHIAVALSGDPSDTNTQFPIFPTDPDTVTDEKTRRKLKKLWKDQIGQASPAQDVIRELQPYQRGNDFASDPLWLIHELDKADKHRSINVVLPAVPLAVERGAGAGYSRHLWPAETGSRIAYQNVDDDFQPQLSGHLCFSWRENKFLELDKLSLALEYVRDDVCPRLAALFPRIPFSKTCKPMPGL
jgi:hypothetical protein